MNDVSIKTDRDLSSDKWNSPLFMEHGENPEHLLSVWGGPDEFTLAIIKKKGGKSYQYKMDDASVNWLYNLLVEIKDNYGRHKGITKEEIRAKL